MMTKLSRVLVGGVGLALALCAGRVEAKGRKSAKPVVCELYAIVADPDPQVGWERPVAVCYDKHTEGGLTLRFYQETTIQGSDGPKTIVVGYR